MKFGKVNVDDNRELAAQFEIRSIPTMLVFRGGVVQQQMVGAVNKATLREKLQKNIA
jgi:thioredoxin 1